MSQFVVKRFGSGNEEYTFPVFQDTFMSNFGQAVSRITRLPGVHGGFDEDGTSEQASEVGNVRCDFTLVAEDEDDMEAKIDAVMSMRGQKRLYVQPSNLAAGERFCYAKARINLTRKPNKLTDFFQPVSVDFSVAQPFWFTQGTENVLWGSGATWGGAGVVWGGSTSGQAVSGLTTSYTESSVGGSANTLPRIIFECGASQTAENIVIQRLASGTVVDEVSYSDVLGNNDVLEIDCRGKKVTVNGADAYGSAFDFLRSEWFEITPGDNSIRVQMANSGDAGTVTLKYFEVYR